MFQWSKPKNWDTILKPAEIAHNTTSVSGLEISLFELNFEWKPKFLIELITSQIGSSVERVIELYHRLSSSFKDNLLFIDALKIEKQCTIPRNVDFVYMSLEMSYG